MLTSGQYAYLLLQKLRISFSIAPNDGISNVSSTITSSSAARAYLYSFFYDVLCDETVIITEEAYNAFCEHIDIEADKMAKNNYHTFLEIKDNYDIDAWMIDVNDMLSVIGIQAKLHDIDNNLNAGIIVSLPSGKQKDLVFYNAGLSEDDRFDTQLRVTDAYYAQMSPFYQLKNIENPPDLKETGGKFAGFNTFWEYDSKSKTLTISGSGVLASNDLWGVYGIKNISKLVIGAGIYGYSKGCFINDKTIIDLHGELDEIIFYGNPFMNGTAKQANKYIVYSDNLALRNYKYGANIQVEWHNLSELED